MEHFDRRAVSTYHRLMLATLVAQLLIAIGLEANWIALLVFSLALGFLSFELARVLGERPFAWTVLGFIPVVGWVTGALLFARGNRHIRKQGLKVSLFGGISGVPAAGAPQGQ